MWLQIKEAIEKHQNFVITTHIHPDGDGIGSAAALIELLHKLGKNCSFICDSPIPEKFQFLNFRNLFEVYEGQPLNPEVLFILDTSQPHRIGGLSKLLENKKLVSICIDHHPFEESFATHEQIDSQACATGALIYRLYEYMHLQMSLLAATGIYVSILCDTCRFSNSCSDGRALSIANECIKMGVNPDDVHSRIFQRVPLEEMKVFAAALQRMETYFDNKVVVLEIKQEDYPEDNQILEFLDLDYILDFNKAIKEVECVVLLRELPDDKVRVSLRSKNGFDIREIVKKMGGGGHKNAAGANVSGTIESVKSLIVSHLEKKIPSANCIAFQPSLQ